MMLASLDETKAGLRIFHDDEDDTLGILIEAASESVVGYMKSAANIFLDSDGNVIVGNVPQRVKWATILLVGYLNENRDSDQENAFEMGYLPKPVMSLLYSLRDPALA